MTCPSMVRVGLGATIRCVQALLQRALPQGQAWAAVAAVVLLAATWTPAHAIPASERTVLVNLYTATAGPSWTNNSGWSDPATGVSGAPGMECSWFGVTCSAGRVFALNLSSNNLVGTLPALGDLAAIQFLVFSNNKLTGAIPSLTGLASLQAFVADHNLLTGGIPSLTGLTALRYFYVNDNSLTGSIPSLAGLSALQEFSVSFNLLTGTLPALTGLSGLQEFYASNNHLTGSIPSLTGLTALKYFYLSHNRLSGTIPSLAGLTALIEFSVGDNQLTGAVPSLAGLTALQSFYIYLNQLTGPMALPPSPSALLPAQSNLCVNQLASTGSPAADEAWDIASGSTSALGTPGWLACQGLAFGDQVVYTTSAPRPLTLTATTDSGVITVTSITTSGDFEQSNDCPPTLSPGASCTANVTFTPLAVGPRAGNLTLVGSTVSTGPITASLPLRGNGIASVGSTKVVPITAQTGSYTTEVHVHNGNSEPITLDVAFYEADNSSVPGQRPCGEFTIPAGATRALALGTQCTLGDGSHFGMLVLDDVAGTHSFTVFSRSQTPAGVGFSVESAPLESFSAAPAFVEGLKRSASGPKYQSNCFVGALGSTVDYRLDVMTADDVPIGNPITGSLQPWHIVRYLEVLGMAGAPAGDYSDVRVRFTETGPGSPPFVGFCTMQESMTFSADFRIAKPTNRAASSVVVPIMARTVSYTTEVYIRNSNAVAITIDVNFFEANNSSVPGQRPCTAFDVPANATRQLTPATQCTLGTGNHFGMLVLEDTEATYGFTVFSRTQTPQGTGFSVEGFPAAGFGTPPTAVEGLRRTAGGPNYLANCFVGALGGALDYRIDLATNDDVPIGSPLTGSLLSNQMIRYLDVLALAGAPAGDYSGVRAKFTEVGPGTTPMVGLCTVQESVTFGADFRIGK